MENLEPYKLWRVDCRASFLRKTGPHTGLRRCMLFRPGSNPEERQRRAVVEAREIETAMANVPQSKSEEVDRLLTDAKKIEAIKVLREATGLGLKLSKMAVEPRVPGC